MSQIEWIYTISWIAFSVVVLAYALCRQPEPAALWGGQRLSLAHYVTGIEARDRPTAAGSR